MTDSLSGREILVVDDEGALRVALAEALRSKGARVTDAPNGKTAAELARTGQFDIVVTDFAVAAGDGKLLIDAIISGGCYRPQLIVMANQDDVDAEFARRTGVAAILHKPFAKAEFLKVVEETKARDTSFARWGRRMAHFVRALR